MLEAAEIDGATGWQKFRYVTLPLLGSTVRLSIFFAVIGSLQLFDLVMPLTGGGPSNSTQTMVTFLYTYGVTRMQVGLRKRGRRGPLRHLRHPRLRLQTDIHAP